MLVHEIEWIAGKLGAAAGFPFDEEGVVFAGELPDEIGGYIGGLVGVGGHVDREGTKGRR